MSARLPAAAVSLLAWLLVVAGCGGGASNGPTTGGAPRPPKDSPALDKRVAALSQGLSVDGVRKRLGEPLSEREVHDEPTVEMLFYGRWQLVFEGGKLAKRVKWVIERPIPRHGSAAEERQERALDRKVLDLRHGAAIALVRSRLGVPDTYAIDRTSPREVSLSYGVWELTFVDGSLRLRTKW